MNLAQSLLAGEAETWFYRSQKRFSFQSWEHLQDLLIWRFGDFSDPELFLLWEKNDRILQEQRVEQRRNIASQLKLPNTKVHVSDSENLRNIEPRTENSVLDNFGTVVKKAKIQQNIRMDVVNGDVERIQRVLSITKNVSAHQVLDKMCQLKGLETKKKMKVLKSWMFKYKPGKRRSRKRHNQAGVYTWSRRESRKNKSAKLRILSTIEYIHAIESSAANVSTFQSNKSSDASSLVIDVKDYSKYGTVIKTDLGHGEKVHELPSQEKILKDGDVITFATGLATYRLSSIPLVFYFCTSSETFRVDQSVQAAVSSIGAHLSLPWSEECTHVLLEPRMQVNEALVNAILANKPIILTNWVKLLAEKSSCSEFPEFSQYRPLVMVKEALLDVVTKPVTECKTTAAISQLVLERSVSHDCFLGSLWEKTSVSWLGVVCVLAECMMHKATVISAKLPAHGLLVFPWNLLLLEFVLFIHLEDKVCLSGASNSWCGWLVFDRGKNNVISGGVITLVFLDLKKCFFPGAAKKDVHTMLLVKANDAHVDGLMCGDVTFFLKHKWRSKHLHTISALECYISSVFPTVTSANSCRGCQRMNEQLQVHTTLIVNNVKSQVKTKWGLVWRIWRLHNLWLVLVQFSVTPKLLEEEVLGPEIVVDVRYDDMMRCLAFGVCSGIKRPIDSRRASRVWERGGLDIRPDNFELCVGHDFVCFYLAFKLEDKLVFQEESIDTILNRI